MTPIHFGTFFRGVASARAALGEEEFKTAWERGRALTLEQTIDYALRVSQPVSQS
jgi:hypothetical protein